MVLLSAAALFAAEKSPLLGLTREQLLDKLGEPKSQLAAGGREVILFARERVVLRNGIVVEADNVAPDFGARRAAPPAVPTPAPAAAPAAAPTSAANPVTVTGDPTPNAGSVAPQSPPVAPAGAPAPAPVAAGSTDVAAPAPAAPAEPQLAIKSVRPPSAGGSRPAPRSEPSAAPVAATPAAGAPTQKSVFPVAATDTPPTAPVAPKADPVTPAVDKVPESAASPATAVASSAPSPLAAEPTPVDRPDGPDVAPTAEPAKGTAKKVATKRQSADPDFPEPKEVIFTGRTYLFAAIIIGAGAGFLIWRRNQRQLELAASAVSRPPFSFAPAASEGAMVPAELLASLEWKRFEELVAAYYSRTGVVAVRTKAGPDSAVHIKISWKGEARPFALVQCLAHPMGLVDVTRIQELFAVLTTKDIRRGYVVTTGKFNVAARDFAEEKHITLISGDLLLEKVNALPPPVRAELLQQFSVGDYTTPSCPKCDAKMVRSDDDPKIWKCQTHPEATVRAWK